MRSGAAGAERSVPALSLTPQMRLLMVALQRRMAANPDVGATFDELKADLGLSSKSGVSRLVQALEERGRIARRGRTQRSIVVLEPVAEDGSDEVGAPPLIQLFSDEEFLAEAVRRGLLKAAH